jgi:hypothetical protein
LHGRTKIISSIISVIVIKKAIKNIDRGFKVGIIPLTLPSPRGGG